tara:strand:- start:19195 stop:19314 length:120 start_codon:yes stop_codon:yes gene_type:complete
MTICTFCAISELSIVPTLDKSVSPDFFDLLAYTFSDKGV